MLAILLDSCSRKTYERVVTIETENSVQKAKDSIFWASVIDTQKQSYESRLDSFAKISTRKDSIFIHDSIFVKEKADGSTEKEKVKYVYQYVADVTYESRISEYKDSVQDLKESVMVLESYRERYDSLRHVTDSISQSKIVEQEGFFRRTFRYVKFSLTLLALVVTGLFIYRFRDKIKRLFGFLFHKG